MSGKTVKVVIFIFSCILFLAGTATRHVNAEKLPFDLLCEADIDLNYSKLPCQGDLPKEEDTEDDNKENESEDADGLSAHYLLNFHLSNNCFSHFYNGSLPATIISISTPPPEGA